jgi:hypothetical protein
MPKRKVKAHRFIPDDEVERLSVDNLTALVERLQAKVGDSHKIGKPRLPVLRPSRMVAVIRQIFPDATPADIEMILRSMEDGQTPLSEIAAQRRAETETIKCTIELKDAVVETEPQEIADHLYDAARWAAGKRNPSRTDDLLNLRRWQEVRKALGRTTSARKAYDEAAKLLRNTRYRGGWSAMRKSYRKIEDLRKAKADTG